MKKRITALMLVMVLLTAFTACGGSAAGDGAQQAEDLRVALILEGSISDLSWDYNAYRGLMKIEGKGAKGSYQENVNQSDLETSIRTYADEGYDVIYLSTSMQEEIGVEVAKDYPDIQFVIVSGSKFADNVASVEIADEEQGFMMGVIAALMSETGKVGFVGASEISAIVRGVAGFEQGAKYINPDIEVVSAMTGSFVDVNLAKETAKAMIDDGVDVVASMAMAGAVGVYEAAKEGGAFAVSEGAGLEDVAPESVLITVNKDTSVAYDVSFDQYLSGTLPNEVVRMGAAEGVVSLEDWYPAAADGNVSDEVKEKVQATYEGIVSGEIEVNV